MPPPLAQGKFTQGLREMAPNAYRNFFNEKEGPRASHYSYCAENHQKTPKNNENVNVQGLTRGEY